MSDNNTKNLSRLSVKLKDNDIATEYVITDTVARDSISTLKQTIIESIFPVGSMYWTSDKDFNPNNSFGVGKWARIENMFIRAASYENDTVTALSSNNVIGSGTNKATVDLNQILGKGGSETAKLKVENLPKHTHEVIDPGHMHKLQTFGDDYNASGGKNQPSNFAGDSRQDDMTAKNTELGMIAVANTTGITIAESPASAASEEFSIMPPYINRYCWERYA